jgi:hypothetical protein
MVAKVPPGKSAKPRGRPKKLKTRPTKNVFLRTDAEKMAAAALLHAEGSSIRDIAAVTGLTKGMVQHRLCSPERPPAQRESVPSPAIKKRRDLVKKLHKKNKNGGAFAGGNKTTPGRTQKKPLRLGWLKTCNASQGGLQTAPT